MRIVWAMCGVLALCFGALGVLLPLVPTVPFMLLAAFCLARSSPDLHRWLVTHPTFGPPIRDWQETGSIRRPAKVLATCSIGAVLGVSVAMGLPLRLIAIQASVMVLVLAFIWSRPEGERRAASIADPND